MHPKILSETYVKQALQLQSFIINCLTFFYAPFKRFMTFETFKYAACGGANTALDISLYFVTYNFILNKNPLVLGGLTIGAHIASFIFVFPVTFSTGFLLSKFITFSQSVIRGRVQLFRYGVTVFICILLNYIFIKLFVEMFGIYPTPAKILTTVIVVIYSYFSQKHFTFKTHKRATA